MIVEAILKEISEKKGKSFIAENKDRRGSESLKTFFKEKKGSECCPIKF
jgi:hypothetical protein